MITRSASPLGAQKIIKFNVVAAIAVLAVLNAGPAYSGPNSGPPGSGGGSSGGGESSGSGSSGTSISMGSTPSLSQFESTFKRTQKELSRLFVLSDAEIAQEFPEGGFDEALVRAANRARRAERAFDRRNR